MQDFEIITRMRLVSYVFDYILLGLMTIALQLPFLLDISSVKRINVFVAWCISSLVKNLLICWEICEENLTRYVQSLSPEEYIEEKPKE